MADTLIPLAQDFDAPSRADWLAIVEKTLKGASFDKKLVSRTYDGVEIQPLYTAGDAAASPARAAPGDPERPWDLRTAIAHPDPARANVDVMKDLEGGAASVVVRIDPTGRAGVAVGGQDDLARVLDGVLLDLAPVALDAGFLGPRAADWLAALAKAAPQAPLAFHMDPLSAFAEAGASPGPVESHVVSAATTGARLATTYPQATLFLASGRVTHEAGGGEALELGFMAAAALAYAKALDRAGLPLDEAFERIVLGVAVDGEYFTDVAKLRAARLIWAKIVAACGAPPIAARIEARSSRRMLTRRDTWVNLLRLTSAGFGAAAGGADAVVLAPFTDAIGLPSALARRQARNTQLVLMEESQLGRVADPAGGSWYLESLTDALARAGWAAFRAIEQAGGAVAALAGGHVAAEAAKARVAREAAIAKRKDGIVGVSEVPNLGEAPVEVETVDPAAFAKTVDARLPGPDARCPPLTPTRLAEPFERLRDRAEAMSPAPAIYLATLGGPSDYTGRVGFAQNLFAAGGVRPEAGPAADYRPSHAPLAVICSSDERYAAEGVAAAAALKASGVRRLYLAGRPGELEAELRRAGVDEFVFAGADVLDILARALEGEIAP